MKLIWLVLKNIRRNPICTALVTLGTLVLVPVVTLVWSILAFLDNVTAEKSKDFKAIVTERWRIPSQMPIQYAAPLSRGAARPDDPDAVLPTDSMTWQFYGGTLDKVKRTRENSLFAFAMEPEKINTMMDELDALPPAEAQELQATIKKLLATRQGIILGHDRLAALDKRLGDRFRLFGINYRDIDLEFEIVGLLPRGRYDQSAIFNRDYLNAAMDAYPASHGGKPHPQDAKRLNLVWLKVPDSEALRKITEQIHTSPLFATPAVKCETQSSGISTFLDAYRDLIWGMRWFLAPTVIIALALVMSNSISILVRQRRTEFAVLKVLGFRPWQILAMVLGESLLVGSLAGLTAAGLTWLVINKMLGGLKFPIAFFPEFLVPIDALAWGVAIGAGAALAGGLIPAWSARTVRVSEVFAKVT